MSESKITRYFKNIFEILKKIYRFMELRTVFITIIWMYIKRCLYYHRYARSALRIVGAILKSYSYRLLNYIKPMSLYSTIINTVFKYINIEIIINFVTFTSTKRFIQHKSLAYKAIELNKIVLKLNYPFKSYKGKDFLGLLVKKKKII